MIIQNCEKSDYLIRFESDRGVAMGNGMRLIMMLNWIKLITPAPSFFSRLGLQAGLKLCGGPTSVKMGWLFITRIDWTERNLSYVCNEECRVLNSEARALASERRWELGRTRELMGCFMHAFAESYFFGNDAFTSFNLNLKSHELKKGLEFIF